MIMGEAKALTASRITALQTGPAAEPAARAAAGEVLVSREPG
jgi:hypothetical protein